MLVKRSWVFVSALMLTGCDWFSHGNPYEDFGHSDPAKRMNAVIKVGEAKDTKAVPHMLGLLTDTEPEVRMFTIISLRKITGKKMDPEYRYYDPPQKRIKAVEQWGEWVRRKYGQGATTRPADRGPT